MKILPIRKFLISTALLGAAAFGLLFVQYFRLQKSENSANTVDTPLAEQTNIHKAKSPTITIPQKTSPVKLSDQLQLDRLLAGGQTEEAYLLLMECAKQDPLKATSLIWNIPVEFINLRSRAFQDIIKNLTENGDFTNASAAIAMAISLSEEEENNTLSLVNKSTIISAGKDLAKTWLESNPMAFADWLGQIPPSTIQRSLIGESYRFLAKADPKLASEYALDLESPVRATALACIFSEWKDKDEAEVWLRSFEPHPDFEPLYAKMAELKAEENPEKALEWVSMIKNNPSRHYRGGLKALSVIETNGDSPVDVSIELANEALSGRETISDTDLLNLLFPLNKANAISESRANALIDGLNYLSDSQKDTLRKSLQVDSTGSIKELMDKQMWIIRRGP